MKYEKITRGKLIKRVNRFIAKVSINGTEEDVHVKNTGRLKELLLPGAKVLMEYSNNPNRKTKYSLIAIAKKDNWVNIDSQAPNAIAFEALREGKLKEFGSVTSVKQEVTYDNSRFDLYYEKDDEKGFIEVKGVTLEKNGIAMFPDAPTKRGTKHVLELVKSVEDGYTAAILFIVQMKGCHAFIPNRDVDKTFADALLEAQQQGVHILAYDSIIKKDELILDQPIPVQLVV